MASVVASCEAADLVDATVSAQHVKQALLAACSDGAVDWALFVSALRACSIAPKVTEDGIVYNPAKVQLIGKRMSAEAFTVLEEFLRGKSNLLRLCCGLTLDDPVLDLTHTIDQLNANDLKLLALALKENSTLKSLKWGQIEMSIHGGVDGEDHANTLDLRMKGLRPRDGALIGIGLMFNTTLTSLNLRRNEIGAEGGHWIGEGLKVNSTLITLNLRRTQIGVDGCRGIGEGLFHNSALTELDLCRNELSHEGIRWLSKGLTINTSLTKLDLVKNMLGDNGARLVGNCLASNAGLLALDLFNNEISEDGAREIAAGVAVNTTLVSLNMGVNQVGNEACGVLERMLKSNTTLERLILYDNEIGDEGACMIGNGLQLNTTLKTLNLQSNNISGEGYACIAQSLVQNHVRQDHDPDHATLQDFVKEELRLIAHADAVFWWLQIRWIPVPEDLLVGSQAPWAWLVYMGAFHHVLALANQGIPVQTYRGKTCLHYLSEAPFDVQRHDDEVQQRHLEATQQMFQRIPGTWRDDTDRDRQSIIVATQWPRLRTWARTLGATFGRYRIDDGPPVHKSATCRVVFAEDLLSTSSENSRVALKFMKHYEEFLREIISRFNVETGNLDDCTIALLGWHVPDEQSSLSQCLSHLRPGVVESKERPERADSEDEYKYALVMECGAASLWHELGTQRIAGHSIDSIVHTIFAPVVCCVQKLHCHGLVHADLKPRNILRARDHEHTVVLCDLDAALLIGQARTKAFKCSTGYCAPEFACFYFDAANVQAPVMTSAYDVWSLGVLLFELCTGQHLFSQDISDDNLVNEIDKNILCTWHTIPDEMLGLIFSQLPPRSQIVEDAKDLIRWCLKGQPEDRPTTQEILDHPFLNAERPSKALPRSMKYHAFLSHAQGDASGTAATIYSLHKTLGMHLWYDMRASQLNLAGMKKGVRDSEVFLIVLTRTYLSRWFCRQELVEAIKSGRQIQIVLEEEPRFRAFDLKLWAESKMVYDIAGKAYRDKSSPTEWSTIVETIDACLVEAVTYRRRAYEQDGMMRELSARCRWHLPRERKNRALETLNSLPEFTIFGVFNANNSGKLIFEEISQAILSACPNAQFTTDPKYSVLARNVLLILTKGVFDLHEDTVLRNMLHDRENNKSRFLYIYEPRLSGGVGEPDAWEFGGEEQRRNQDIGDSIDGHEALPYRRKVSENSRYRHEFSIMMNQVYRILE
jgi:serine/threonine protein kinase/Ran GTPase-activating protein (RanGAP) involved in mRNA processing and transport